MILAGYVVPDWSCWVIYGGGLADRSAAGAGGDA
jgi:hypothetical protein